MMTGKIAIFVVMLCIALVCIASSGDPLDLRSYTAGVAVGIDTKIVYDWIRHKKELG